MATRKPANEPQLERRIRSYDLYLQGWTQSAIARDAGVSLPSIGNDIATMRAIMKAESGIDIVESTERELQRLDRLERVSWEAWERSRKPSAKVKTTSGESAIDKTGNVVTAPDKVEKWTENREGTVGYLTTINNCIAKRCQILGLDAPTKIDTTQTEFRVAGKTPQEVRDEIIATIAGLLPDNSNETQIEGE